MNSVYEKIDHCKPLPFECFITSLEKSYYHWHEDYEVIFLLKGNFSVWMDGNEYNMNAGDFILVNSKEVHSIQKCKKGNIALFIQFEPDILLKMLDLKNRRFYFYLNSFNGKWRQGRDCNYFRKLFANVGLAVFEKKNGYEFYASSYFYHFLGDLFRYVVYDIYYIDDDKYTNDDNIILDKLTEFVKENYTDNLMTDDLCDYLGVSRSTLYRYLKDKLGMSLTSFINYYRIEEAKKLLRNTDYDITHISGICGFSNQPSFYRVFKKETNMTPNEFRKKEGQIEKEEEDQDQRIRGYTSYSNQEAYELLKEYSSNMD